MLVYVMKTVFLELSTKMNLTEFISRISKRNCISSTGPEQIKISQPQRSDEYSDFHITSTT